MKLFYFVFMLCLCPSMSFALGETESMRCNNGIVSPGDSKETILEKCGQPVAKRINHGRLKIGRRVYYGAEEWTYDFGRNEFMYIAVINNNKVEILYSTREYGVK